eukprot:TRINITY_DN4700_c0_g1_i1.p1 TRINITY_DN4700_c0_g1~~TRINITY_DN4700_c0_g1_i1.p1  ORF type:complete len:689 (+),score=155.81 TRINITY_DN4700_c0_g1_i1:182-2068(+)
MEKLNHEMFQARYALGVNLINYSEKIRDLDGEDSPYASGLENFTGFQQIYASLQSNSIKYLTKSRISIEKCLNDQLKPLMASRKDFEESNTGLVSPRNKVELVKTLSKRKIISSPRTTVTESEIKRNLRDVISHTENTVIEKFDNYVERCLKLKTTLEESTQSILSELRNSRKVFEMMNDFPAMDRKDAIQISGDKIFGVSLENISFREKKLIPEFVFDACYYLETNIHHEDSSLFDEVIPENIVIEVKKDLDSGIKLNDIIILDVYIVSNLLKVYLSELEEPLGRYHLYQSWISSQSGNFDEMMEKIKGNIELLPDQNKYTLSKICFCCSKMAQVLYESEDYIDYYVFARNLGPLLIYAKEIRPLTIVNELETVVEVVSVMIEYCVDIFENDQLENPTRVITKIQDVLPKIQRNIKYEKLSSRPLAKNIKFEQSLVSTEFDQEQQVNRSNSDNSGIASENLSETKSGSKERSKKKSSKSLNLSRKLKRSKSEKTEKTAQSVKGKSDSEGGGLVIPEIRPRSKSRPIKKKRITREYRAESLESEMKSRARVSGWHEIHRNDNPLASRTLSTGSQEATIFISPPSYESGDTMESLSDSSSVSAIPDKTLQEIDEMRARIRNTKVIPFGI